MSRIVRSRDDIAGRKPHRMIPESQIIATLAISFLLAFRLDFAFAGDHSATQGRDLPDLFGQWCQEVKTSKVMSASVRQQYIDSMNDIIQKHKGRLTSQYKPSFLIAFAFDESPQTEQFLKQYRDDRIAQWALTYRAIKKMKPHERYKQLIMSYDLSLDKHLKQYGNKPYENAERLFLAITIAAALDEDNINDDDKLFDLLQREPTPSVKFELVSILIATRRPETLRLVKEYINNSHVELSRCAYFSYNKALDCIWEKRSNLFVFYDPMKKREMNEGQIMQTKWGAKKFLNQRIDEIVNGAASRSNE